MLKAKPVIIKRVAKDCESCLYKGSDFTKDTVDPNVIRVYCKARHVKVNAELMTGNCDHWFLNKELESKNEVKNHYGL